MRPFFIALLILGLGCSEQEQIPRPDNLIEEGTYIQLLVEFQLLDAIAYTSSDTLNLDSLRTEIFTHYQISEERFSSSHRYYQSKPDEHTARLDSALNILKREHEVLEKSR